MEHKERKQPPILTNLRPEELEPRLELQILIDPATISVGFDGGATCPNGCGGGGDN
jgi:hypothetical protein